LITPHAAAIDFRQPPAIRRHMPLRHYCHYYADTDTISPLLTLTFRRLLPGLTLMPLRIFRHAFER